MNPHTSIPPSSCPLPFDSFSGFSPGTKQVLLSVDHLSFRDRHTLTAPPPLIASSLFDGVPSSMQDLQCQLGEFMQIEHFHHTGFLSIPDACGVPRDIFRDSNSLVLSDFERAEARLLADTTPAGIALAKLSTLLFLKLQNLCTPAFQALLRGSYKPFYGTSFLLYYAYMLEYCHLLGVGTVIDIEIARDQLSPAKLVLAFRTYLYDVVKFFAAIASFLPPPR